MPKETTSFSKIRSARNRIALGLMGREPDESRLDVVLDAADAFDLPHDDAADFRDFEERMPAFDSME